MVKFNALINLLSTEGSLQERLSKEIEWPVLPQKGDIFLLTIGTECVVESVLHQILKDDEPCINVYFEVTFGEKSDFMEHGWMPEK